MVLQRKSCAFCLLVNTLDGDALHSRSHPSDLDMIEAKLPLYNNESRSDSSCSEEDDLQALALYFDTRDIKLNPGTFKVLKNTRQRKNSLEYTYSGT